jgi:hypothetical protein
MFSATGTRPFLRIFDAPRPTIVETGTLLRKFDLNFSKHRGACSEHDEKFPPLHANPPRGERLSQNLRARHPTRRDPNGSRVGALDTAIQFSFLPLSVTVLRNALAVEKLDISRNCPAGRRVTGHRAGRDRGHAHILDGACGRRP